MAPALISKSFLLTTTPHSKLTRKHPRLTVFAKTNGQLPGFRIGKRGNDEETEPDNAANGKPFGFDFSKIPDVKSLIPVVTKTSNGLSFGNQRNKDPGTVFVAGATGQAGVRIAQTLLRDGFRVRAGVPDLGAAQEIARFASKYKIISNEESKRINAVESSFQDAESIAKAIGNASKVVVTIGPTENGPTSAVTPTEALQVIQAAELAGVGHVAVIYDGSKTGASTNNVLDGLSSFFTNLFSRSEPLTLPEFLKTVVETTNISYTLIKTNLTEDFSPESNYNIVVSAEGSAGTNDYKVSKSQIASLVTNVFSNTAVAENKVVEVSTDPTAPSRPVAELFGAIPEDGRRKAYTEAVAKAKAEEEAMKASENARESAEAAKKLEKQEARASSLAEEAQEKAAAAGTSVEGILSKAKDLTSGLSWDKFSSQVVSAVQKGTEEPKVKIATVRGQAKARNLIPKKAVTKQPKQKVVSKPKTKQTDSKAEVRKLFGGLFQQQTIYIDDE